MLRRHPVLSIVTAVYLVAVGWITLSSQPQDSEQNTFIRGVIAQIGRFPATSWVTYNGVEFTANIAMFVPMGVLFTLLLGLRRWWVALLIGVVATCTIEFIQLFLPTRYSDVRDLIANTTGTLIGIGVVALIAWLKRRGNSQGTPSVDDDIHANALK
ncbi:VanZ family protein [Leifsonia sp. PS1209]|uniref:VanZ family protein n=1 Tax=Leifsonia sp. PS1209 TaxID=2724914 RepID=UPI001442CF58|nr:VanZ family protein [Leifsonia sp. PS1209]QIZ98345.1 VanZ family protein [Leifsonia sp. PS1209]